MSWIRGTATDYLDFSNQLVEAMTEESLDTVDSIANGGTGGTYVVGDILTLTGGTSTIAAQVEVTGVSAGQVTATRRYNDGVYTVTPSDPVSTSGGGGTGCTLNVSWIQNGWTANEDTTWTGSERQVQMQGSGGGSDQIFVGWRTFSSVPDSRYNMELHGMTGYDSGLDFDNQPGVSPGFFDGATNLLRAGAYLLLANSSMQYWVSITPYRVVGEIKVGSAYFPYYLGWGNRFATSTEYPYPLIVAGHSSRWNTNATQGVLTSSLTDPWKSTDSEGSANGPMLILDPAGTWYSVWNGTVSGSARSYSGDRMVTPCGRPKGSTTPTDQENQFISTTHPARFLDFIAFQDLTDPPSANLHPTPGSSDYRVLFPTAIVFSDPSIQILAELDNVYYLSAFGGLVSEDRVIQGSDVYRVFQNCNRTDIWAYLAIKEG